MQNRQNGGRGGGGSMFLITALFVIIVAVTVSQGLHKVEEGHIGVYWRGGALLNSWVNPGFHVKIPFITTHSNVQVTIQTDVVRNIPCGTSGGVLIYFDKIEVVNKLAKDKALDTIREYGEEYDRIWIFDKIHHEINQFCSSRTLQEVYIDKFDTLDESLAQALQLDCTKYNTGIDIVAIRVTKPKIPESVAKNYEAVEEAKTKLKVAIQQQEVSKKQEETERLKATIAAKKDAEVAQIQAEKEANVSKINVEKLIAEKEGDKKTALIQDEIYVAHERALTDASSYDKEQAAAANEKILTPAYLKLQLLQALANNTKIYFGDKIPSIFLDFEKGLNEIVNRP